MKSLEQFEKLVLIAREHKLDVDDRRLHQIRIGGKWYYHHFGASIALLSAFDRAGIQVPQELKERPEDIQ